MRRTKIPLYYPTKRPTHELSSTHPVRCAVEVSFAYPMLFVGYIVNAVAGYYLFQENLSLTRITGILIICVGAYFVTRS